MEFSTKAARIAFLVGDDVIKQFAGDRMKQAVIASYEAKKGVEGSPVRSACIACLENFLASIVRTAFWGCNVTAACEALVWAFVEAVPGVEGSSIRSAFIAFNKAMLGVEGFSITPDLIKFSEP